MKPMLLSNADYELEDLDYTNMYISAKRDGVRAEISNKGILNRSLKTLRNTKVQEWFKPIWSKLPKNVIIEAEVADDSLPCRTIAGICNSDDRDIPEGLKLYVFGLMDDTLNFEDRMVKLKKIMSKIKSKQFVVVMQHKVSNVTAVNHYHNEHIKNGYEGSVLMRGDGFYKHGRVTINEGIGYKIKTFTEYDLEIVDVIERMKNLNKSQINELGNSFKRNTKLDKIGTKIAATFIVKLPNGEECGVTITGDELSRKKIWNNKEKYIGKIAIVKSFDYGTKTKLRHPVLVRIKEEVEY